MIYGHGIVSLIENRAPKRTAQPSWKTLSEASRLALIERALAPAKGAELPKPGTAATTPTAVPS